ncbi:hypothetical protein XarbCFBP8153_13610 [Xanthomonas arboricola]|nr:hypothetical protein XarbCFBP8153_13610 [Xanthomonas arboricola]
MQPMPRKKRRTRAPDPDPPPSTPGLSPGTRVRQSLHCAASRNGGATALATAWRHRQTNQRCDVPHRRSCAVHP